MANPAPAAAHGARYLGLPLVRCARLTATARGGQAVLSTASLGSQSASAGRVVDLRVDGHAEPVAGLARLINGWRVAVRLPAPPRRAAGVPARAVKDRASGR